VDAFVIKAISKTPPEVLSIGPASGSTDRPVFPVTVSDGQGSSNIGAVYLLFSTGLSFTQSCLAMYERATDKLWLLSDDAIAWMSVAKGSSLKLQNSQCTVESAGFSTSTSGSALTVNFAVTFKSGFAGQKQVYGRVMDSVGFDSGWKSAGTWNVVSSSTPTLTVDTVTASGAAGTPTFTAVYSDGNGYPDVAWGHLLLNTGLDGSGACYVGYYRPGNSFYLMNDVGNAWQGPLAPDSAGVLENSQCTLNGSNSTASGSGNSLTVTVSLTFKAAFAGSKNIYVYGFAASGLNSGWQSRGTWTVPTGIGTPTAGSVTGAGAAGTPTFTAVYSDGNGYTDLAWGLLIVNSRLDGNGACYVGYYRPGNSFYLMNDAGSVWQGPLAANSAGVLENSQCAVNGSGSTASGSGNTLTVIVSLSFKAAFAGSKNIYVYGLAPSGLTSGWQSRGTWTVPAGIGLPTADSVTGSGAAATPSFTAVYSDGKGYTDLAWGLLMVNSRLDGSGACYVGYYRPGNSFYLMNDAGSAWQGPLAANSAGVLQNSQCALNGKRSVKAPCIPARARRLRVGTKCPRRSEVGT
jgi:hypothetical protein